MVGSKNEEKDQISRDYLGHFKVLPLTSEIAERAVTIRKEKRIKLPDAIIWATALCHNLFLVTRNTHDFKPGTPGIQIPYQLFRS